MAAIRVNKSRNYTVMSNHHLRNKELSLKAKGLLSVMLSLPDGWDYSIAGLCSICKESETAVKSTLSELKSFGYMKITKKNPDQTASGRYEYVYDIFEFPQDTGIQDVEKQGVENQPLEFQPVENVRQLNTNKQNKDELNTEEEIKDKSNTNKTNIDNKDTKDIYTIDHKGLWVQNIYTRPPEVERGCGENQSRYISPDYSEEELIEHIRPVIAKRMSQTYGTCEYAEDLIDIIAIFYRHYYEEFGTRHRLLSDHAYRNIVDEYMDPPETVVACGFANDKDAYLKMMHKYFLTKFNKSGNYKDTIHPSVSHFMSANIIDMLARKI